MYPNVLAEVHHPVEFFGFAWRATVLLAQKAVVEVRWYQVDGHAHLRCASLDDIGSSMEQTVCLSHTLLFSFASNKYGYYFVHNDINNFIIG